MPDDETPEPEPESDTYTPRKTRYVTADVPAPSGGTRTVRYRVTAGTTYTLLSGEEADRRLGYAAVNNVKNLMRASARP